MPKRLTAETQDSIKSALLDNRTPEDIADELGISSRTVRTYAARMIPDRQKNPGGRRHIVPNGTKKYIRLLVIRGHLRTAKEVHLKLQQLGYSISYSSTRNVLKSMNFHARIKKKKPLLTKKHMKIRLAWAKKYRNWTVDQWRQVVFSDETKVNIWGSDGCKYYWKRPGDPLQPHHLDVTVKHSSGSLMLWGCITSEGPGYACQVYDGNMDSATYQHILGTTYMESLEYYGMDKTSVYLQHDNDPKHKSRSTTEWLATNGVRYIEDWPAQSPDLNPIEHVWHHLKLRLSLYETRAANVEELWERVNTEWDKFTGDDCRKYIDSMPSRIEAVIKAKGGSTRY